jgi:hypothetical protein
MLKAFAAGMTDRTVTASEYSWLSPRGINSTETLMVFFIVEIVGGGQSSLWVDCGHALGGHSD